MPAGHQPNPISEQDRIGVLARAAGHQLVEPGDPVRPLRQQPPAQHRPGRVLHHNMVMVISPVIPDKQQPSPPFRQQQGGPPAP